MSSPAAPGSGANSGTPAKSGASPAASPAPAATPAGGGSSSPSAPGSGSPASSQAPTQNPQPQGRSVKPIRPIQDQTDNDKMSAVERRRIREGKTKAPEATPAQKTTETAKPGEQGQPTRGPDGRFVAAESSAEALRGDKSALEARKERLEAEKSGKPPVAPAAGTEQRTPEQVAQEAADALENLTPEQKQAREKFRKIPNGGATDHPDGPAADGRFVLGGKVYKDPAAAGQAHRSLQGIHRSLENTAREGTRLARGWEEAYHRDVKFLKAELQKIKLGGSPAAAAPSASQSPTPTGSQAASQPTPGKTKTFSESMDWNTFNQLYNSREFGPVGAQMHLASALDSYINELIPSLESRIEEKYKKSIEPLQKTHQMVEQRVQSEAALRTARETWNQIAQAVDPETGEPYYPELHEDPKLIEEILPIWLSFDPNFGMTDNGVFSAYLQWKHYRGLQQTRASAAGQTAASVVENLQQNGNAAARAVVVGGGTHGVSPTPPTANATRQARERSVIDGIKRAQGGFVTSSGINLGRLNR